MMTSNIPAEALVNPGRVPSPHSIRQVFWDCLLEAERTFGRRAAGWNYRVELAESGPPMTTNDGHNNVTVWLTTCRSWIGYYYEAAHEAVHCLNPIPFMENAKYLEEAMATEFSLGIVRRNFGNGGYSKCGVPPQYEHARILASEIDRDTIRLGQRLRKQAIALEYVTSDIIKALYPNADAAVIETILDRLPG